MLLGLGSSRFARHYSGNHYCFLFLGVLRCFSSPRLPHIPMDSVYDSRALPLEGCPIRKSPGLRLFSTSPEHIAGIHVLHRLMVPRHPPYALSNFTFLNPIIQQVLECSVNLLKTYCAFDYIADSEESTNLLIRQRTFRLSANPLFRGCCGLRGLEPPAAHTLKACCKPELLWT